MTVKTMITLLANENSNTKIALKMFGGLDIRERYFVPITEALDFFDGWLEEEVKTMYNGTYYTTCDWSNADAHFPKQDYIVLEYFEKKVK